MSRQSHLVFALIALAASAVACNTLLPSSLSPGASALPTEDPYLEIPRVTVLEAKAAFDSGAAVFVDVRSQSQYERGHIAGALSIPLDEAEARMAELDPNDWIITYCT